MNGHRAPPPSGNVKRILPVAWLFAMVAEPAVAQQAVAKTDATPPVADDAAEIVVKGQAIRADLSAFSTTSITTDVVRAKRVSKVEQLLRDVPGMFVSDYGLGGVANATVIRGFGAGGHGGDLGVVLDGIPLNEAVSHADGYVDLSVVVPLEVSSLTVFKGPVSALYGNFNRGGLIALQTRKGGDYAQTDLRFGSFDTLDAQAAFGTQIANGQDLNVAGQYVRTDGFRPQSNGYRATLAARYNIDLTDTLNLALAARLHKAFSNDPAYITLSQYRVDPYGIDPRVQNDAASKRFGTSRADLGYALSSDIKLLAFGYTTQQRFARSYSRPVTPAYLYRQREETYQRQVYGGGTSLNGSTTLLTRPVNFVLGVEAYSEATNYQFYDGLIQRQHTGPAIDDRRSTLKTLAGFGEAQVSLHRLLDLSLGFRVDRFTGACTKRGAETTTDPCTRLSPVTPFSPKVGLRSQLLPWLQLRASYAKGFALPDAFIKYAAGAAGLTTIGLKQKEIGIKLTPVSTFDLDVAAYRLNSSGEIATVGPGVYQNLGATLRKGVEASINWRPAKFITLGGSFGYAGSEVRRNANPVLIGKRVTGVPHYSSTFNVAVTPVAPLTINATDRYVGHYFADAANTLRAADFNTIDFGASYALPTRTPIRLTLNIDNAFDKTYATAVFLSQGAPLLAPAAPRAVRGGVQVDFR